MSEVPKQQFQAIIGEFASAAGEGVGGGGGNFALVSLDLCMGSSQRKLTSSLVFSAIILWIPIPTPSITPNRMAHPIAEFLAAFNPPRTARAPPVKKPAIIALYGSSFFLMPLTAQSNVENSPPHTPKLPPSTGARALMAVTAPIRRSP